MQQFNIRRIRMISFDYVVKDEAGIHARPASLLAKKAKSFKCTVTLSCNGWSCDARKLMMVMAMGVKKGDTITITVDGEEEEKVAVELKQFFEENF